MWMLIDLPSLFSHEELLATKGIYADMWNNQISNEGEGAAVQDSWFSVVLVLIVILYYHQYLYETFNLITPEVLTT